MMNFHLSIKSVNKKTGPIPVTTSDAKTCSPKCGLFKTCYAKQDHRPTGLASHWDKVSSGTRSITFAELCATIANFPTDQVWRHNQAGDLPGIGNRINASMMRALVAANIGKRGYTYTHKPRTRANIALIREANLNGFTISLSTDNVKQALKVKRAYPDLPVVTILPSDTTAKHQRIDGIQVITCPAALDKTDTVNCSTCKLCALPGRSYVIGFPAHGRQKGRIDKTLPGRVSLVVV
jgi:hypothetical protein